MIKQHNLLDQMDREIGISFLLKHPSIVQLLSHFRDSSHAYFGMARWRAWRELHDGLREDDQVKDNQYKTRQKQNSATVSDEVERRSSIPRGMTYLVHQGKVMNEKKTIEENNIGAETRIEMSLRLLGGMDASDMKD